MIEDVWKTGVQVKVNQEMEEVGKGIYGGRGIFWHEPQEVHG